MARCRHCRREFLASDSTPELEPFSPYATGGITIWYHKGCWDLLDWKKKAKVLKEPKLKKRERSHDNQRAVRGNESKRDRSDVAATVLQQSFKEDVYCPICGLKDELVKEGKHVCPSQFLSAIDGAHRRDPDSEEPRRDSQGKRLTDGLDLWKASEDDG